MDGDTGDRTGRSRVGWRRDRRRRHGQDARGESNSRTIETLLTVGGDRDVRSGDDQPTGAPVATGRPGNGDTVAVSHGFGGGASGSSHWSGATNASPGASLLTSASSNSALISSGGSVAISDTMPASPASAAPASGSPAGTGETAGSPGVTSGLDSSGSGTGGGSDGPSAFAGWSPGDTSGCFDLGCSNVLLIGMIGAGAIVHLI